MLLLVPHIYIALFFTELFVPYAFFIINDTSLDFMFICVAIMVICSIKEHKKTDVWMRVNWLDVVDSDGLDNNRIWEELNKERRNILFKIGAKY